LQRLSFTLAHVADLANHPVSVLPMLLRNAAALSNVRHLTVDVDGFAHVFPVDACGSALAWCSSMSCLWKVELGGAAAVIELLPGLRCAPQLQHLQLRMFDLIEQRAPSLNQSAEGPLSPEHMTAVHRTILKAGLQQLNTVKSLTLVNCSVQPTCSCTALLPSIQHMAALQVLTFAGPRVIQQCHMASVGVFPGALQLCKATAPVRAWKRDNWVQMMRAHLQPGVRLVWL
jgi:hypothetical protein